MASLILRNVLRERVNSVDLEANVDSLGVSGNSRSGFAPRMCSWRSSGTLPILADSDEPKLKELRMTQIKARAVHKPRRRLARSLRPQR